MKKRVRKIGIVGGNLTSALLCIEARKREIEVVLLDKDLNTLASPYANGHIVAEINSVNINRLALRTDTIIITTPVIWQLADEINTGIEIYPSQETIKFISNRIEQVKLANELNIPTPAHFYGDNLEEIEFTIQQMELPFKYHQLCKGRYESCTVQYPADEIEFDNMLDGDSSEYLLEDVKQYKQLFTVSAIKNPQGKIVIYPISEEGDIVHSMESFISTPANTTKVNQKKIIGYVKKILKATNAVGLYSFKFGLTEDKKLEWLYFTPGVNVGDVHTNHYMEMSVYEQFLNMIEGINIIDVDLLCPNRVHIAQEGDDTSHFQLPYHLYKMDRHNAATIHLYVLPEKPTDTN
ncbi:MAG: hypothetical protein ATN36_00745 [Epulopiscium sp. Nele67-Bin005]|nr:MAG: hypothetical protein ATN36_00745 [Epulopiscium sp. Nele67-Bin005]